MNLKKKYIVANLTQDGYELCIISLLTYTEASTQQGAIKACDKKDVEIYDINDIDTRRIIYNNLLIENPYRDNIPYLFEQFMTREVRRYLNLITYKMINYAHQANGKFLQCFDKNKNHHCELYTGIDKTEAIKRFYHEVNNKYYDNVVDKNFPKV